MVNADQEVWVESRVGKGKTNNHNSNIHSTTPTPFPNFFLSLTHLVQIISFSPQPAAVIKIKDGGYDFHLENTVHSLPEIMPVL